MHLHNKFRIVLILIIYAVHDKCVKKSTLSFDQNVPLNCQSEIGRQQWRSSKCSQAGGTLNRSIYFFSLAVVTNVNKNSI